MDPQIDFEDAKREWRKNKIHVGNGYFKYKCEKEGCDELLFIYIVRNKYFSKFASEFDIQHQNHAKRETYCENHLLSDDF